MAFVTIKSTTSAYSRGVKIAKNSTICYTILMRTAFAIGLIALTVAPVVASAQTYMGPEEVFLRDYKRINARSAKLEVAKQQQAAQTSSRPTVVGWWEVSSSSAPVTAAASSVSSVYSGPETSANNDALDPATLRWLARLQNRQAQLEAQNQYQQFQQLQQIQHSTALYSGAPLVGSGLASNMVFGVVLGAIGFTLYRVRRARKFLE